LDEEDPDGFEVGHVLAVGYSQFQLRLVNSKAMVDGTFIGRYENVVRLHRASPYLNLLNTWIHSGQPVDVWEKPLETLEQSLDAVKRDGRIATLHLSGETSLTGFVVNVEDDMVELQSVDEAARPAGRFYLGVPEIEKVEVGRSSLLALEYVHQLRTVSSVD
jgi:hypothetical protein